MNYTDEFFKRLRNGESIDTIAQEMTAAINAANDQYQKEVEMEAKRQKSEEAKRSLAGNIAATLRELLSLYKDEVPAPFQKYVDKLSADDVLTVVEELLAYFRTMYKVSNSLEDLLKEFQPEEKKCKCGGSPVGDRVEDPIQKFLDKYVR